MTQETGTTEQTLEAVCDAMLVDMDGLARQAAPNDAKRQDELKTGENLGTFINVLFNADNSIADVLRLILKAAEEPYWKVNGYFREPDGGKRNHLGEVAFRAPDVQTAGDQAWERLWEARLTSAGCTWVFDADQVDHHEANSLEDDTGTVRRL